MPAITMRYRSILSNALDDNTIRFASAASFGHRVYIPVSISDISGIFTWTREVGESVPTGIVDVSGFADLLESKLMLSFSDRDLNTNGLDFSSAVLDVLQGSNTDVRKDVSGSRPISVNDLVMAYLLFRCFARTNYSNIGEIYNLADAHNMISNSTFVDMFTTNMNTANGTTTEGNVQATNMLRDQLANDTARYITGNTAPAGLFNTGSTDVSGEGSMVFLTDDIIEFPVRLVFIAPVSVASISDDTVYLSGYGQGIGTTDRQVIQGEVGWDGTSNPTRSNVLAIRFQLVVIP